MLRRIASSIVQSRGLKQQVKITWVRPDYVPAYKAERSGDLEPLPPIPDTALGADYALCEEIKDAPEAVKKILSVGHLGRKEYEILVRQELKGRVKRHNYDQETAESKIAQLTAKIRCLQADLEECAKNKKMKVFTQELIDRRKKLLKFMRQYDYKKFEWLLEKLNIEYKAHPDSFHKLTRKESLRRLTEMHCEDIRDHKLNEYRNLLESQQGPFLTDKLESLRFIRSEQLELKLPVTVTEQDISRVAQQLEEWKMKDEVKRKAKKKKKTLALETE